MTTSWRTAIVLFVPYWLFSTSTHAAAEPKFEVVVQRAGDKVEVAIKERVVTFSVHSPMGIGNATIRRTDDKWPAQVILKLHLTGLEGLRVSNGKMELVAERFGPDGRKLFRIQKSNAQQNSPDSTWFPENEIRGIGSDGKPSKNMPLPNGYFEVLLPKAFLVDNPDSITFHWVDFYR